MKIVLGIAGVALVATLGGLLALTLGRRTHS